ncbi:MAG: hypothetical protein ACPGAA_00385, partial [Flavobacteriaceae bacterium]
FSNLQAKLRYSMPIYKKYIAPHNTQILVWHITEDETTLSSGIVLTKLCVNRLGQMKSDTAVGF